MKQILIKTPDGMRQLDAGTIAYFQAQGNYSRVFLNDKTKITSTAPLKHYEALLKEENFYRIHHACLLNTDMPMEIKGKGNKWVAILPCKTMLEISARKRKRFIKFINEKHAVRERIRTYPTIYHDHP